MRTIFYARVSTREQTIRHQIDQARQAGFTFDDRDVLVDEGVSGVSVPLRERPQGRRLFDLLRPGDTLVVRWLDRLGRNYQDVTETVREFIGQGAIIRTVINGLTFDGATKDPMQKALRDAMIAFLAALAEAQADALKIAQRAGIEHAKAEGAQRPRIYKGRKPSYDRAMLDLVNQMLAANEGPSDIAAKTGLTRQTVLRIRADPAAADAALRAWGG
ncbi:recombinase family protein [Shinella sumterensis]|uniref:Recombinase family protein n=1 Tax=Shinella sumterensis TaxID=1967501 RepID=A0AA50H6S0_9HYPH|nr:recombinase family protein [Shinella sumterensis]WLR98748.1 recombinase family protein [Shinella sumterensis]